MANKLEYTLSLKDLMTQKLRSAASETGKLDSAVNKVGSGLGRLAGAVGIAFSVGAVVNFGKAVIDSLKNYEYFNAAIKTMLGGDAQLAKALQDQLVDLAKTSPFELTEVQDASKQLLAYGFKAGDLVDTMKTLGNVSSGVGAPLGDIAYLYGTLKTSGRVMQVDLRQFAGRGIPIYETLAKVLHTNTKNVNELVHDGKVGFKDIEKAFQLMTKEGGQFFNLMDEQSKTVGGKISNLGDAWEQVKVNIGKSQHGIIASTVDWVSEMTSAVNTWLVSMNRIEGAFDRFGIKNQGFWSKIAGGLRLNKGAGGVLTESQDYDQQLQVLAKSKYSDKQKNNYLKNQYASLYAQYKTGQISSEQYSEKGALLFEAIKGQQGQQRLKSTKETSPTGKSGSSGSDGSSSSIGSGTEVTGARPQNLTINVTKLVESLNINTTNLKEGVGEMRSQVSKALLELLNDANQTAFQS